MASPRGSSPHVADTHNLAGAAQRENERAPPQAQEARRLQGHQLRPLYNLPAGPGPSDALNVHSSWAGAALRKRAVLRCHPSSVGCFHEAEDGTMHLSGSETPSARPQRPSLPRCAVGTSGARDTLLRVGLRRNSSGGPCERSFVCRCLREVPWQRLWELFFRSVRLLSNGRRSEGGEMRARLFPVGSAFGLRETGPSGNRTSPTSAPSAHARALPCRRAMAGPVQVRENRRQ